MQKPKTDLAHIALTGNHVSLRVMAFNAIVFRKWAFEDLAFLASEARQALNVALGKILDEFFQFQKLELDAEAQEQPRHRSSIYSYTHDVIYYTLVHRYKTTGF